MGLQEGLGYGVRPGTQGGTLALSLHYQANHYLYILGMLAWLLDVQRQEGAKQNPKIGMIRVSESNADYSH